MAVFYVSTTGSDSANGLTLNSAFATLERAQFAMQQTAGSDSAYVRGGTYELHQPLTLTALDNGNSFAAYGNEKPVLSGGLAITQWTNAGNGLLTAHVAASDVHQLTINGVQQNEARFPNVDINNLVKGGWLWAENPPASLPPGFDSKLSMMFNPANFKPGQLAPGMEIHVTPGLSYSNNTLKIASVDMAKGIITFTSPADYPLDHTARFFVQDAKVHLDTQGEWWFDTVTHTMNFRAPPGFDGKNAVASGIHDIIHVEGARNINISGFTFSDATTGRGQIDSMASGVAIHNSNNIHVESNKFTNLEKGVYIYDDGLAVSATHNNVVANNDFTHIWSSAIDLDNGTQHNLITGNSIRWAGEVFVQLGAINMRESYANTVSGNLIRDVARSGIFVVNYNPNHLSGGHLIENNTVIHALQGTSDAGSIYVYSASDLSAIGDIIRYNRVIDSGGVWASETGGGFVAGQQYSAGIYLDDYVRNTQVYQNFVQGTVRGGILVHGGSGNTVHDNIVLDNKDIGIQVNKIVNAMIGNEFYRNIIEATYAADSNTIKLYDDNKVLVGPAFHDNFYYNPRGLTQLFSELSYADWKALGFDARSAILTNNIFVNPSAGDYTMKPGVLPLLQHFAPLPWDIMTSFRGGHILTGTTGIDVLYGTSGDDILDGLDGSDTLYGGNGNDDLVGGAGSDVLIGGQGADRLDGGAGFDTASYRTAVGSVTVSLADSSSNKGDAMGDVLVLIDRVDGSNFADQLTGNSADNFLYGLAGNDNLIGGAGKDFLNGGSGADTLTGGTGFDKFVYSLFSEGGDHITDFSKGDHLVFKGTAFGSLPVGNFAASSFVINAPLDSGDRFIFKLADHSLWYDADGTGSAAAHFIATFTNNYVLSFEDFLII